MKVEDYNGYKVGAAKRKFKMGRNDFKPGTLITNLNAQKVSQPKAKLPAANKITIMGAM